MRDEIKAAYGKKSMKIVEINWQAIDATFDALTQVQVPAEWATLELPEEKCETSDKPSYITNILEPINRQEGNDLSVGDLIDNGMLGGFMPMGTAAYEKRGVALEVPEWSVDKCTMCNECAFICPHAAIRPFLADEVELKGALEGFITREMRGADGLQYRIQVSLEDCTGCGLCVEVCPAKEKALALQPYDTQKEQAINWAFAMTLSHKVNPVKKFSVKGSQFEKPLLEFSGACSGCGETPYVKLLTQLYGDRMMIANTTGCSSIWGASSPATPYTTNDAGQGPAWSNSLFEDNAEYGLGMHVANQTKRDRLAKKVTAALAAEVGADDTKALLADWLANKDEGDGSRQRATKLATALRDETDERLQAILADEDMLVKPSQWIIGGDGWAYDIGYAGIDHILATNEDVNILVMDNELYAITGGQMSKATPTSAIAKFAAGGKKTKKKDLGMMAIAYNDVYVAQIAIEANPMQAIKAISEAESYPGPSVIIGYTPCINHGLRGGMSQTIKESKEAVESGYWQLYRYDPRLAAKGKDPMRIDYKKADFSKMSDFLEQQTRFSALRSVKKDEQEVQDMLHQTVDAMMARSENYNRLAAYKKNKV